MKFLTNENLPGEKITLRWVHRWSMGVARSATISVADAWRDWQKQGRNHRKRYESGDDFYAATLSRDEDRKQKATEVEVATLDDLAALALNHGHVQLTTDERFPGRLWLAFDCECDK